MRIKFSLVLLALLALTPLAARADPMSDLQARFKERYARLVELKQAGTVGETSAGMIGFVKAAGDAATQQFVQAENNDRTELYKLIAAKEGTTPDKVAQVNARRNFEKAKPGEWLQGADGKWKQKTAATQGSAG